MADVTVQFELRSWSMLEYLNSIIPDSTLGSNVVSIPLARDHYHHFTQELFKGKIIDIWLPFYDTNPSPNTHPIRYRNFLADRWQFGARIVLFLMLVYLQNETAILNLFLWLSNTINKSGTLCENIQFRVILAFKALNLYSSDNYDLL